jgi:hypothetical protein
MMGDFAVAPVVWLARGFVWAGLSFLMIYTGVYLAVKKAMLEVHAECKKKEPPAQ